MNLSQLSDKLEFVEKVIQFCQYRGDTGRGSGLEAFSRYRAEAAWHRRSFERAHEPLHRSRGSSRTGRDSRGHGQHNTRADR